MVHEHLLETKSDQIALCIFMKYESSHAGVGADKN